MPRVKLMPNRLDRITAEERLPPDAARILQRVDMRRPGQISRGLGASANQRAPSSTTLTALGSYRDVAGNFVLIDCANGAVQITVPDTAAGTSPAAPLPMW